MIRSVEFDLETWSPNAERFSSDRGRHARDNKIKAQRKAVRETLNRAFGAVVPMPSVLVGNVMQPNRIRVRFTRIAAGTLDAEENLPMAFKHVKDEIAEWCGFSNDRNPIFAWGPYDQEKAAPHVLRVRLVIEDLAPGDPRRVALAATAHIAREDTARVKKRIAEEQKKRNAVQVYRTDKGARAASSGARARAEAAFAKMTGTPLEARVVIGMLNAAPDLETAERMMVAHARKPTATDLRDAAERRLVRAPLHASREEAQAECDRANAPLVIDAAGVERLRAFGEAHPKGYTPPRDPGEDLKRELGWPTATVLRDPGDEARPEALADCETCRAKVGTRCTRIGEERLVYGVHVSRARAAGLTVPADDRAAVRPARSKIGANVQKSGQMFTRKLATVPGQARLVARQAFVAYPWRQPVCDACSGEGRHHVDGAESWTCSRCDGRGHRLRDLTREPLLEDVRSDRPQATFNVPLAHRARWGDQVTLYRREWDLPGRGRCWVYDAAKPHEGP